MKGPTRAPAPSEDRAADRVADRDAECDPDRDAVTAARDLGALEAALSPALGAYGFTAYAFGFLPSGADPAAAPPPPFLLNTWPMAWLETYAREGFAREDAVVEEARAVRTPFTWSELRERRPAVSARIFAAAAGFGWHDGFCVPVHDPRARPGERLGVASLAAGRLAGFGTGERDAVAALARTAFSAAKRLRSSARGGPELSARERQALAFVAAGLGDAEIARAMGVRVTTAHDHVERAKRRLGARTRAQAVALALARGALPEAGGPPRGR